MSDSKIAEKLALGMEISAFGLGEVDYVADTIILDDLAASFFDLPANDPIPRDQLHARIHPDDWIEVEDQVRHLLYSESEGFISVVHRVIRPDESIRWISARKKVEFDGVDADGQPKPISGLVAIQDITEFKDAEAQIAYLLGEMAHRSKNLLSVIHGLARLTARKSSPEDFMQIFTARLSALGANQSILLDDNQERAKLSRVVSSQIRPFKTGDADRISLNGPSITVNEKSAQAIGMAIHELATNAVKYGALSNSKGTIDISWMLGGDDKTDFTMRWLERGGPEVTKPSRKGFGETVIRQMAASSVGGVVTLDYDPLGVCWTLKAKKKNLMG